MISARAAVTRAVDDAASQTEAFIAPKDGASEIARRVFAERVNLFYRQLRVALAASVVIAGLLVLVLWSESGPSMRLLGWISAMILIQLARLLLHAAFVRAAPGIESARTWARLAVISTAASGLCWGASVLLFFDPSSPTNLIVMTMAATGMAAGGIAVLATLPLAYILYVGTHLPPLIVLLAVAGGFVNLVMAAAFIVFILILLSAVRTTGATLEESLRLRFERIGMIEHLEQARAQAESASRAKSEFLAMMTHELKTPLNSIIGYSELISEQPAAQRGDKLGDYARDIHDGAHNLLTLINDILDLSKADAGKLNLQEGLFSVEAAIERCRRAIQPRADEGGIELRTELAHELPALRGDERLIRHALINLLSNAVKFTRPGGLVRIGARRTPDGGIVIDVTDSGIGMAPEDIPRALEPFQQIDHGLKRERTGSGLGLTLAKRFAELHRGRIEVASRPGVGTTARLVMPADRVVS